MLRARAAPIERAVARICREGRAVTRQPPRPHRTGTTRLRRDPARPSQRKREQTYSCSRRCHLVILGPNRGSLGRRSCRLPPRLVAHPRPHCARIPSLAGSSGLRASLGRPALAGILLELLAAAATGVDGEPLPFAALADVRWHAKPGQSPPAVNGAAVHSPSQWQSPLARARHKKSLLGPKKIVLNCFSILFWSICYNYSNFFSAFEVLSRSCPYLYACFSSFREPRYTKLFR